jgi:hypothetical protein
MGRALILYFIIKYKRMTSCQFGTINDFQALQYQFANSGDIILGEFAGNILLYYFTNSCVTPSVPYVYVEYFETATTGFDISDNFNPPHVTLICPNSTITIDTAIAGGSAMGGLSQPLTVQWIGNTLSQSSFVVTYGGAVISPQSISDTVQVLPRSYNTSVCCGYQGYDGNSIVYFGTCNGSTPVINGTTVNNGGGGSDDFFERYKIEIIVGAILFLFIVLAFVFSASRRKEKEVTATV